jgi:ABC-2 type transport system permease protein
MDMENQLTGFITIIKYTIKKLLFSKRMILTLLVMLFVCGIMGYATTRDVDRLYNGTNLLDGLILFFFMPVMAMIYGSSLIRDEMDDRSITQVVTSPMNRIVTYFGYYIGLAISVSIIMLIILTAGFFTFFGIMGLDSQAGAIYSSMAAMVVIGSFVYSSLFIMVSVLISHPIYFGLFYAFIWEGFIGSIPGSMRYLAIKHYIRSLGTDWISYGGISEYNASSVSDSALVLIVFVIIMFLLGAFLFKGKEFT